MANLLELAVNALFGNKKKKQDKETEDYFKVIEARRALELGQIKNDPRNNDYTYKGVLGAQSPSPTPSPTMAPTSTSTPTPTQGIIPTSYPNQQYVEQTILPLTRKEGLPDELVAGQWAGEGRFVNPENNNLFNLMYGGKLHKYQNIPNNIADYALTIKNIVKGKGKDINKMDALEILKTLQEGNTRFEGHNKDPKQYVDLITSTPEYKNYVKALEITKKKK